MNRHRQYWSVMGVEPNPDERVFSKENLTKTLEEIIQLYGFNNTVTALRHIKENNPEICKEHTTLFI